MNNNANTTFIGPPRSPAQLLQEIQNLLAICAEIDDILLELRARLIRGIPEEVEGIQAAEAVNEQHLDRVLRMVGEMTEVLRLETGMERTENLSQGQESGAVGGEGGVLEVEARRKPEEVQ